jgi:MFS transporter, SP family, arabinose:H+ symporter
MQVQGKLYVTLICLTAALGGFLFGFDTAVISGAINLLRAQFHLNSVLEGWVMSSALVGCVIGAAISGYLADKFGRKKILLLSALLFVVSAVGCALAMTPATLVVARMVGGIGVGFAAMVAPMFISELSPAKWRGRLVSLYQLAITLGILCSYLSNSFLLRHATDNVSESADHFMHFYRVAEVWRGMLGSNMIPALFFFLFLLFVPESPRWLVKAGRPEDAGRILRRINGDSLAAADLAEITKAISAETGVVIQWRARGLRMALIIGIVLPFLSQLTGITTVMYYAPAIFEKSGLQGDFALGGAAVIGFFNMLFTVVAILKIDKWGRRPLLIGGFTGLSMALFLIGWTFNHPGAGSFLVLASFIFYIALFAATLGPGVWVVISEIYPTKIRGRAMSMATLCLFLGSTFVRQTYPILRESIGIGNVFFLYGLVMLPAAFFVKKYVPETKGASLEKIERYWKEKGTLPSAGLK